VDISVSGVVPLEPRIPWSIQRLVSLTRHCSAVRRKTCGCRPSWPKLVHALLPQMFRINRLRLAVIGALLAGTLLPPVSAQSNSAGFVSP
jgi:hypothetical protein